MYKVFAKVGTGVHIGVTGVADCRRLQLLQLITVGWAGSKSKAQLQKETNASIKLN